MHKILTIVGARPQFIKAAALSHVIRDKYSERLAEDILHTGQHYDDAMSGRFFSELEIPLPRYNLGVGSGSHGQQTGAMLAGIEKTLLSERYDGVVVYGDTNSTLAGALAAAKLHIPVFHVEAGLRSFNRAMPEEINRIVADHVATLLFAPTQTAVGNLRNEGFNDSQIVFSGDVMLDNVLHYTPIALQNSQLSIDSVYAPASRQRKQAFSALDFRSPLNSQFFLATVHRDFNTDSPTRLRAILSALSAIAERHNTFILFPVHPRTRKHIDSMDATSFSKRIRMVEPLSYLETLSVLHHARLVLTDSGGLQKEAFFAGKGCVILRPETEWLEIVENGAAILADGDERRIVEATDRLLSITPPRPVEFGDGHAAERIVESILQAV